MALWVLDAAHGGEDAGIIGAHGLKESDFVLEAVLEAKRHLERNSESVILTRDDDINLTIDERVKLANSSNGDFFISFHMNSDIDENIKGVKVVLVNKDEESYRLGRLIRDEILSQLRTEDMGVAKGINKEYKNLKNLEETYKILKDDLKLNFDFNATRNYTLLCTDLLKGFQEWNYLFDIYGEKLFDEKLKDHIIKQVRFNNMIWRINKMYCPTLSGTQFGDRKAEKEMLEKMLCIVNGKIQEEACNN